MIIVECRKLFQYAVYSKGSNSEHSNTESIRKPNVFMFCIGMFGFRMVGSIDIYSYGTDHSKTELSKWPL